jgi:hypothetical protein
MDVKIGAANARRFELDLYGAGLDLGFGGVDELDAGLRTHLRDRFHGL